MNGYVVRRERARDWRIYRQSPFTGDLKECVGWYETATEARAACARLNVVPVCEPGYGCQASTHKFGCPATGN